MPGQDLVEAVDEAGDLGVGAGLAQSLLQPVDAGRERGAERCASRDHAAQPPHVDRRPGGLDPADARHGLEEQAWLGSFGTLRHALDQRRRDRPAEARLEQRAELHGHPRREPLRQGDDLVVARIGRDGRGPLLDLGPVGVEIEAAPPEGARDAHRGAHLGERAPVSGALPERRGLATPEHLLVDVRDPHAGSPSGEGPGERQVEVEVPAEQAARRGRTSQLVFRERAGLGEHLREGQPEGLGGHRRRHRRRDVGHDLADVPPAVHGEPSVRHVVEEPDGARCHGSGPAGSYRHSRLRS